MIINSPSVTSDLSEDVLVDEANVLYYVGGYLVCKLKKLKKDENKVTALNHSMKIQKMLMLRGGSRKKFLGGP